VGSASLGGQSPPRVRFRLARRLDAPSGEVRLARGSRGHTAPVPAPSTGTFNALTPAGHTVPLTRLGVTSRRCSTNPPGEAIPATVRHCAVRLVSAPRHFATHSRTAGGPHPRKRTAEPSKGDGHLFHARTGPCRDVGSSFSYALG
jgi:hypothetical protein